MAYADIKLGSTFDAKGFKQALTASQKLEKNVKNLAKGFAGVFAAKKVLQFGVASVKAFAADDAAAKSLGKTLQNLGLAYGSNAGTVNGYIARLEKQTGVLDDELRPAMDRLLRATGDVTKSQELLGLALDIAAGTGKSVEQVSQSLQKAYLGQTQALGRLGVGLSKAELTSSSFADIQKRLNDLFAGQAVTAANSYQGSINKLQVAANNAKETIGKGLVDALGILSSSGTVDPTVSAVDRIANSIANAAKEAAKFIAVSKKLFSDLSFFKNAQTTAEALRIKMGTGFTVPMTISSQDTQRADKIAADKAKAAAAAKAKADKLAVVNKTKADKLAASKDLALKKAAAVFDLNKIQIAAALKATYDKDERLRLLAMQAIENDNGEAALEYIKQLNLLTAEQQTNKLAGIKGITETELSSINGILLAELDRISKTKMTDEEAAAARAEAYRKYNAAIIASGGLAEANFYSEKTQSELLTIAKLAAISKVAEAQATLDILSYTSQTDIIARVAKAQALADAAKMDALKEYLAEAGKTITQTVITKNVVETSGGDVVVVPDKPKTNAQIASDLLAAGSGAGAGTSSSMFNPYAPGNVAGFGTQAPPTEVTINIDGFIDTGNFDEVVNQAMINAMRKGYSQYPAGSLP
jgi:hypothetical protein